MVRKTILATFLLVACSGIIAAQSAAEFQQQVPYYKAVQAIPGLTYVQYIKAINEIAQQNAAKAQTTQTQPPTLVYVPPTPSSTNKPATDNHYIGTLSVNPYLPNSVSNPYGQQGSPYSPQSINNPFGAYGSPYSPTSATNPYATNAPKIVAQDGQYLGKLSTNPYDPELTSNSYGKYGSPYSPTSINNPYSVYGSQYSPLSPNNPYATQAPLIIAPRK